MGLLDDAIREHLELKRKRGADTHEVERQEQEALGPPLRGEFAPAPADPDAEPVEAALPAEVDDAVPELPPEAPEPAPEAAEPAPALEPELPPEPVPAPEPEPRGDREGRLDEPAEGADDHATTEYTPPDVEQPAAADPPPAEDVLEETPEFLQETPEHERLWFEQKPPRDFDLDR